MALPYRLAPERRNRGAGPRPDLGHHLGGRAGGRHVAKRAFSPR
jgi:hypothetical protein